MPFIGTDLSKNLIMLGTGYCFHEITTYLRECKYIKTAKTIEYSIFSLVGVSYLNLMMEDYKMGKLNINNFSFQTRCSSDMILLTMGISSCISIALTYLFCSRDQLKYVNATQYLTIQFSEFHEAFLNLRLHVDSLNDKLNCFRSQGG
jgi:hypothetical protein